MGKISEQDLELNTAPVFTKREAEIIGISRHRFSTDGDGVTTLVAFRGCPLRCRYCLNPHSLYNNCHCHEYSPDELYAEVRIDELYFMATNGGVTFGGGEPCLYPQFIRDFRDICGTEWRLNAETSLNVPTDNIKSLLPVIDTLIIDIKDMDTDIYLRYTGKNNDLVIKNLRLIADYGRQHNCIIRLPLIHDFNTEVNRSVSRSVLEDMGFYRFDLFTYKIY